MEDAGVKPERFTIDWASAAEAPRFVDLITSFTRKIEQLGPMGQAEKKDRKDLMIKLSAAKSATLLMKLRAGLGNLAKDFRKEGDYNLDVVKQKVREKLGSTIKSELGSQEIMLRLERQGPLTMADLAGKMGWPEGDIAGYLGKLAKKKQIAEKDGYWMAA